MAERFVGRGSVRHLYFDCRQSWVIPAGDGPGWYIVPMDVDPAGIDPGLDKYLSLAFANDARGYKIYHWSALPAAVETLGWQKAQFTTTSAAPVQPPLPSDELAYLVGGFANGSTWASVWQARSATAAPVSVLMHLYEDGDSTPVVGDGLGFVASSWQPGDIFVQYHDFDPADGQFLETGLYDYTNGQRLPFELDGTAESAIRISR